MLNKVQTSIDCRYTWRMEVYNGPITSTAGSTARESRDMRLVDLLARVAARDNSAIGEIYDICAGYVYGLALKICQDSGLAEEITSDVFVYVWQSADKYDTARGKVLTWMLTICRSRAIDALRRGDNAETNPDPTSLTDTRQSVQSEPLNILQTLERNSEIYQAMKTLDVNQQHLLSLAFFRGLSHQQITEHTGQPLGTIKSQIRNAMMSLREVLKLSPDEWESNA